MCGFAENPYPNYRKSTHNVLRGWISAYRFVMNSKAKNIGQGARLKFC